VVHKNVIKALKMRDNLIMMLAAAAAVSPPPPHGERVSGLFQGTTTSTFEGWKSFVVALDR